MGCLKQGQDQTPLGYDTVPRHAKTNMTTNGIRFTLGTKKQTPEQRTAADEQGNGIRGALGFS